MDTGAHVGSATDDLKGLLRPDLHPANTQLVGSGVGLPLLHPPYYHPGRPRGEILNRFHLKTGDREALGEPLWFEGLRLDLHEFPEPLERNPHPTAAF
jgi:hypothetical protein